MNVLSDIPAAYDPENLFPVWCNLLPDLDGAAEGTDLFILFENDI